MSWTNMAESLTKQNPFDILSYWKNSTNEYPIFSQIARDMMAIQVSCVCPGSGPISVVFPPIFVRFRDPVYSNPTPVLGFPFPLSFPIKKHDNGNRRGVLPPVAVGFRPYRRAPTTAAFYSLSVARGPAGSWRQPEAASSFTRPSRLRLRLRVPSAALLSSLLGPSPARPPRPRGFSEPRCSLASPRSGARGGGLGGTRLEGPPLARAREGGLR